MSGKMANNEKKKKLKSTKYWHRWSNSKKKHSSCYYNCIWKFKKVDKVLTMLSRDIECVTKKPIKLSRAENKKYIMQIHTIGLIAG